jgi:[protein-PII] uridylyltransferase
MDNSQHALGSAQVIHTTVVPGPSSGTWTVTFRAEAVPGTLAAFAGTLTLARLDILSALVHRGHDGMVTDSFDVAPLEDLPFGTQDAEGLSTRASAALAGDRDLAGEIAELRRRYPGAQGIDPEVTLLTDSEVTTGIKVVCADHPGLLFDLTSTLTRHGLRTRSISMLTFRQRAHDTFRVVNHEGRPVTDERVLRSLETDLLNCCR